MNSTEQPIDAIAWLTSLGDKWLGDGICQSVRASDLLASINSVVCEAGGWRPIETAPKDGSEVILREGSRVGAAGWITWPDRYDVDGSVIEDGGEGWTVGHDGDEWRTPDAWQPMPPAHGVNTPLGPPMDGDAGGGAPSQADETMRLAAEFAAAHAEWLYGPEEKQGENYAVRATAVGALRAHVRGGPAVFKDGLEKAAMTADEAHAAFGHLAPKDGVEGTPATGWPPGMLQDDPGCTPVKGNSQPSLSKWLASKPDARLHAREAADGVPVARADGVVTAIASQSLADAARVLAEFAKTAPGRLPQRVQDAIAVAAGVEGRKP